MMQFAHPALAGIFDTIHRYPTSTGQEWAWAQNVHLEGRVSQARQDGYEAKAGALYTLLDPTPPEVRFSYYHNAHLKDCVFRSSQLGQPPDTFHPANQNALVQPPGKRTVLVRVDDLSWPMEAMHLIDEGATVAEERAAFERLRHAFRVFKGQVNDPTLPAATAQRQICYWLDNWNNARDARPVFAAPLSSTAVQAAFRAPDGAAKAAALRNLLGLGHFLPSAREGRPVFALILKYEVGDVLEGMNRMIPALTGGVPSYRIDPARAFAAPTVLDGPLYPWFFPSPPDARVPGTSFGRTVHLDPASADPLAVELLHPPFPYQPRDIHDIVEITDPGPVLSLHAARTAHVAKVRDQVKDASAFGAPYY